MMMTMYHGDFEFFPYADCIFNRVQIIEKQLRAV